jgi:protein-L-isoaspartate(D-aspartate) O-methyltransferase
MRRLALILVLGMTVMARAAEDWAIARENMVGEIVRLARSIGEMGGKIGFDERVLAAMRRVPRHEFVPKEERRAAYRNRPLPIGHGQTISQPFIVALMTDLLRVDEKSKVLEVGTGSGYQAAVLAELAGEVYSIEIVEPLGREAASALARLGYSNVRTRIGDGYEGWKEHAPYDAIVVTAAPDHVPPALVEQLKPGGRLVIPVGGFSQDLMVIEKQADGRTTSREVIPVRFVPLTRSNDAVDADPDEEED